VGVRFQNPENTRYPFIRREPSDPDRIAKNSFGRSSGAQIQSAAIRDPDTPVIYVHFPVTARVEDSPPGFLTFKQHVLPEHHEIDAAFEGFCQGTGCSGI